MFIEPDLAGGRKGWIEVICGSMFSGKTEELIRRLKRARIANLKVEIFKPASDIRYHIEDIVSHNANSIASTPIESSTQILLMAQDVDVVGIDEAQFFDPEIIHVCQVLAFRGIRVIVAGLDMDYLGKPFGQMPHLLSVADYITKLHAICVQCGNMASFSYRKANHDGQFFLGETSEYEPLCRQHYFEKTGEPL